MGEALGSGVVGAADGDEVGLFVGAPVGEGVAMVGAAEGSGVVGGGVVGVGVFVLEYTVTVCWTLNRQWTPAPT